MHTNKEQSAKCPVQIDSDPAESAAPAAAPGAGEGIAGLAPSARFVKRFDIAFARSHQVLGLAGSDGPLQLAMADPDDQQTRDVVRRWMGRALRVRRVEAGQIQAAINHAYGQQAGAAQEFVEQLDRETVLQDIEKLDTREDLLNVADRAPVIKLVNLVLFEAVRQQASDIHVQPYEDRLVIRMRIDGVLFDTFDLPAGDQAELVSRIKVMSRMNIAEKRLPQDGRASVQIGDRQIDLRVSTVPASHGERVVIRLLDKSVRLYTLDQLGMAPAALRRFADLIGVEHGLILVTGPTGSGKTTTLYAALGQINSTERNIITLEDPIEYQLDGISQIQIAEKKGMTFASGLRSVLRQDPDIVMIGEIRDRETAVMAIQSALTGHLVFSTLHTNDAASAVTRLLDLGIEPYLVSSSLVGVLAQRLVRRVCGACSRPVRPNKLQLRSLGGQLDAAAMSGFRVGSGCPACRQTGYQGRAGVFELLRTDEAIRRLIQQRSSAAEIHSAALDAGMQSLAADALGKATRGITSLEEVHRISMQACT
ncbi:MAG: type II secretion system ATPase GspE [Planctomycetota bacterium]